MNERATTDRPREAVDLAPASAYEALTRQMLDCVARDVAATRERVDALFYLVIGSLTLDVLLRLVGA